MLASVPVLLLVACRPTDPITIPSTTPDPAPSIPDPDPDPDPDPPTLDDIELQWRVHDTIASLIVVSWEQPADGTGRVEFSVDPGEWLSTPTVPHRTGPTEALLLGIPYDHGFTARVVSDLGSGEVVSPEVTGTTGPIPARFPPWSLLSSDATRYDPTGRYVLGSVNSDDGGWIRGQYFMWILDRQGRLVWAHPGVDDHMTIYLHVSQDGDILWDVSTFWSNFDGGRDSQIHRMKIDGVITETLDAPGMHHCFTELPDGSIVWGSADGFASEAIERRWPDGSVTTVWDCTTFDSVSPGDWCHTNAIFYRQATDTLLLSFPTNDSFVAEVSVATGEVLDWWGHIDGAWAFAAPDEAFWYQHGATFTDAGTLLLSSHVSNTSDEGMVREYTLDHGNRRLDEVWRYGDGDAIRATNAGEAHRLPSGNTLHNTGTTPRIREITADGEVVWDLSFTGTKLMGRTVLIDDLYRLAPD